MSDHENYMATNRVILEAYIATVTASGGPRGLSVDDLILYGLTMYERGSRFSKDEKETSRIIIETANAMAIADPDRWSAYFACMCDPAQQMLALWAGRWCDNGFPSVVLGHRQAASMMCTSAAPALADQLRPPWSAFLVRIPSGLLDILDDSGKSYPAEMAFVHSYTFDGRLLWSFGIMAGACEIHRCNIPMDRLLEPERDSDFSHVPSAGDMAISDKDTRAFLMLGRLIVGLCLLNRAGFVRPASTGSHDSTKRRSQEPRVRTYKVAHDVRTDCRSAVRDYVSGKAQRSPTVQCLVRGHWKHQACGVGRSERKLIHVEPYWRGPEDAPIAVRSHVVGEASA